MPQLNPLDWGPQLVWLVITFGVLYALMKWVALPRIGGLIEQRQAKIARDLAAADKLRHETDAAIAAYEEALAEAKQKAHQIIEEERSKLAKEVAAERKGLEQELAAKAVQSDARIAAAKGSALKEVNAVAADVGADIVHRLIGVSPSGPEIAKAVAEVWEK
jgi:F-type H+-transporting ATPase subunit b